MKTAQVAQLAGTVAAAVVAGLAGMDFADLPSAAAEPRPRPTAAQALAENARTAERRLAAAAVAELVPLARASRIPAHVLARAGVVPGTPVDTAIRSVRGAVGEVAWASVAAATSTAQSEVIMLDALAGRPRSPVTLAASPSRPDVERSTPQAQAAPPAHAMSVGEAVVAEAQRRVAGDLTPVETAHARELGFATLGAYAAARDAGRLMAAPFAASCQAARASGISVGARIAAEMAIGGGSGNATARGPNLASSAPSGLIRFSGVEIGALAALAASSRPRAVTPETMTQAQHDVAARFSKTPAQFCAEHNSLHRLT